MILGNNDTTHIEQALTARDLQAALQSLSQVKYVIADDSITFQAFVGPICVATITLPAPAFMQIARDFALKQKQLEDVLRVAQRAIKTKA